MNENQLSRRDFIAKAAAAVSGATLLGSGTRCCFAAGLASCPIVVFSKIYQELDLNFADAAAVTAEAGLDGVDCPVRPDGEILPERASEDLPRYAEELRKYKLRVGLLTTGITSISSPHTETILRTAKKLGIPYYRLGFANHQKDVPLDKQVNEVKARLKDVAAMNKEIGIGALFQNHSSSGRTTYMGGNLNELREIVSGFDPSQVGAAFDIGHAIIVHGDEWRGHFEKLKSHLKIAYVKDAKREGRWVPFGQGDIAQTGYFTRLKELGYNAPFSLHIEFDWSDKGKSKNRQSLVKALKESNQALKRWLSEA